MIDVTQPDKLKPHYVDPGYVNTPASDLRPAYHYVPRGAVTPVVSIITPYFNMGPLFEETVRSVLRMSYTQWEWLIVDDGSGDDKSLAQLEQVGSADARIHVIHQPNSGPGVARNTAFAHANGTYLFQLDCDDLVEPTFVEKAVWLLETQPQFGACGSFVVGFGAKEYVWARGFQAYEHTIDENTMTNIAVIRRSVWAAMGGYDPAVSYEHADWDFWLTMAEAGWWGYTLPEYLAWYRIQSRSLLVDIETNRERAEAFRTFLHAKHQALRHHFPHPTMKRNVDLPYSAVRDDVPVANPLAKRAGAKRILLIAPWLERGDAEDFDLRLIESLTNRGYEFTVATTRESPDPWLSRFTSHTPDVFCLHRFLNAGDYPRFLTYLIASRQIDAVLIAQSALGYLLTPYLRAHHPQLPVLDVANGSPSGEAAQQEASAYSGIARSLGQQLDLTLACSQWTKRWMVDQGATPSRIEVVYPGIDTHDWNPAAYDRAALRRQVGVTGETPIMLFSAPLVDQTRPMLFLDLVNALAGRRFTFHAIMVCEGPKRQEIEAYIRRHHLRAYVRVIQRPSDDEMRRLLAASDILLRPGASGDQDSLARLYECMAMETVPVAALASGEDELVTPECGILVPMSGPRERDEYIMALEHLLRHPSERRRMAAAGRQRVVAQFDLSALADSVEAALTLATARARARSREPITPDDQLVRHVAQLAIEYARVAEAAETPSRERHHDVGTLARLGRAAWQRILPQRARRSTAYRRVRTPALALLRSVRSVRRR